MTSHFCGCSGSFGGVSENGAQPKNCNLAVTCTIKPWLSSGVGLYPSNLTHTQLLGIGWWEDLQDRTSQKIKFSTPASFLQQITTPLSLWSSPPTMSLGKLHTINIEASGAAGSVLVLEEQTVPGIGRGGAWWIWIRYEWMIFKCKNILNWSNVAPIREGLVLVNGLILGLGPLDMSSFEGRRAPWLGGVQHSENPCGLVSYCASPCIGLRQTCWKARLYIYIL